MINGVMPAEANMHPSPAKENRRLPTPAHDVHHKQTDGVIGLRAVKVNWAGLRSPAVNYTLHGMDRFEVDLAECKEQFASTLCPGPSSTDERRPIDRARRGQTLRPG